MRAQSDKRGRTGPLPWPDHPCPPRWRWSPSNALFTGDRLQARGPLYFACDRMGTSALSDQSHEIAPSGSSGVRSNDAFGGISVTRSAVALLKCCRVCVGNTLRLRAAATAIPAHFSALSRMGVAHGPSRSPSGDLALRGGAAPRRVALLRLRRWARRGAAWRRQGSGGRRSRRGALGTWPIGAQGMAWGLRAADPRREARQRFQRLFMSVRIFEA